MKTLYHLIIFLTLVLVSIQVHANQHINVIGEHFPPFQFEENGEIKGFSVDLTNELMAKVNLKASFNIYPWARAFHIAQTKKDTLLLTVTRTKPREEQLKWIGSIAHTKPYLWALKQNKQAKELMIRHPKKDRVAVQRNGHLHEHITKTGFDKKVSIFKVTAKKQAIKMLYQGRVEYIMGSKHMLPARIKELGLDPTQIEAVAPIDTGGSNLSIAFSTQTSDETVLAITEAFNEFKQDGTYQALLKKWRLD